MQKGVDVFMKIIKGIAKAIGIVVWAVTTFYALILSVGIVRIVKNPGLYHELRRACGLEKTYYGK